MTAAGALDLALVRDAVAEMTSPGRLEIVRRSPVVIVDAAHNPAGMAATVAALDEAFSFTALIAVLAISADKDVPAILDQLEPVATELVATTQLLGPGHGRRRAGRAGRGGLRAGPGDRWPQRLDDAIEVAVALADEADADSGGGPGGAVVLIAGSVITAGEARAAAHRGRRRSRPARPGLLSSDGEPGHLADDPSGDPHDPARGDAAAAATRLLIYRRPWSSAWRSRSRFTLTTSGRAVGRVAARGRGGRGGAVRDPGPAAADRPRWSAARCSRSSSSRPARSCQ